MDGLAFTNAPTYHYYASPPDDGGYSRAAFANHAAATPAPPDAYAGSPFHLDGANHAASPVYHRPQQPYAGTSSAFEPVYTYGSPDITTPQSASPASHFFNVGGQPQQNFPNSSTPPSHTSMAAPPLPQSPANAQPPNQPATAPTPPASQSPSVAAPSSREAKRMALLLEINEEILAEIQRLQADQQGGAISLQHQMSLKSNGQPDKMASEDYIQLLRRLQGNLAYMMPRSGQPVNPETKILAGPAFMQHPPPMPQLAGKYDKLRELFPEWPGNDAKLMAGGAAAGGAQSPTAQMSMQQRMQQMQHLQQKQLQQQQFQQANANGVSPYTNTMQ